LQAARRIGNRRHFAEALARKRRRFAFPDEFNSGLRRFQNRIKRAEGKATPEGRLVDALEEIRVQASPDWDAAKITVFFWFLAEREKITDFDAAHRTVQSLMSAVNWSGTFELAEPAFIICNSLDLI
jgi:hypothetical protein